MGLRLGDALLWLEFVHGERGEEEAALHVGSTKDGSSRGRPWHHRASSRSLARCAPHHGTETLDISRPHSAPQRTRDGLSAAASGPPATANRPGASVAARLLAAGPCATSPTTERPPASPASTRDLRLSGVAPCYGRPHAPQPRSARGSDRDRLGVALLPTDGGQPRPRWLAPTRRDAPLRA